MRADSIVRARIPTDMKEKAVSTLHDMGLTSSDLIRLVFMRVAEEGRLPFDVKIPNRVTRQAIAELEAGKGIRSNSVEELFENLMRNEERLPIGQWMVENARDLNIEIELPSRVEDRPSPFDGI